MSMFAIHYIIDKLLLLIIYANTLNLIIWLMGRELVINFKNLGKN